MEQYLVVLKPLYEVFLMGEKIKFQYKNTCIYLVNYLVFIYSSSAGLCSRDGDSVVDTERCHCVIVGPELGWGNSDNRY